MRTASSSSKSSASVGETSDREILDLLRQGESRSVAQLAEATAVTATAVRQRLNRLMGGGLVERRLERSGRGRPSHRYSLTDKGLRDTGNNYADLALALWKEVREIKDPEVRRGLLKRLATTLGATYLDQVDGRTLAEKMKSLAGVMGARNVPFEVDESGALPVLTALACPYPDLAAQDRTVCSMEKMLFSELLGEGLKLTDCRLDGAGCCTFEATGN